MSLYKNVLGWFNVESLDIINDIINLSGEEKPDCAKHLYSAKQIINIEKESAELYRVYFWYEVEYEVSK